MRLLRVVVAVFVVLALTGLGLMFYYAPTVSQAVTTNTAHHALSFGGIIRGTHFWAAHLLGLILLLHLLALITRRSGMQSGKAKLISSAAWLLLLAVALWFTGLVLPWDQLTYWLTELAHKNGIRLSLLQIYWAHIALLPIAFGASWFFYVRYSSKGARPSSPQGTAS